MLRDDSCAQAALLKQRYEKHTKKYGIHTIIPTYQWYAMMSYQMQYVMYTVNLDAT